MSEFTGWSGLEAVLNHEKLDGAERLFEQFVVGEGDRRVGCDEPEGFDLSLYRSLNDVWIGEATSSRYSIDGDVPDAGEGFAVRGVVELAIAREGRGEARLASAHGVALSGDGEGCGTRAANVAGHLSQRTAGQSSLVSPRGHRQWRHA